MSFLRLTLEALAGLASSGRSYAHTNPRDLGELLTEQTAAVQEAGLQVEFVGVQPGGCGGVVGGFPVEPAATSSPTSTTWKPS
ncbi:hypothetical protein [Streptomyces rubiginosohelvolus]|uniref:hypothetical protein n=1 Tax=Streptomyces rubiginosohelvolus TaxID=67362 RepID=UPI0037B631D0